MQLYDDPTRMTLLDRGLVAGRFSGAFQASQHHYEGTNTRPYDNPDLNRIGK
jgi:hypothetical protein